VRGFIATCVLAGLAAAAPVGHAATAAQGQSTAPAAQTDLTGTWRLTIEMEVGRATPMLELAQNEGRLSGTYTGRYGSSPVTGEVDGRAVKFSVAMETTTLTFAGQVQDDGTMAGTGDFGEMGTVTWTAARDK